MTTVAPAAAPQTTREQIEAAILDALTPTGTKLVPWRAVAPQVPGDYWSQAEALGRLVETYEVTAVKVRGSCLVRLADPYDRLVAAVERERAAQTGWPIARCRDFVAV